MVSEDSPQLIRIYPEDNMNTWTTFTDSSSISCWYFGLDQSGGLTGIVRPDYNQSNILYYENFLRWFNISHFKTGDSAILDVLNQEGLNFSFLFKRTYVYQTCLLHSTNVLLSAE